MGRNRSSLNLLTLLILTAAAGITVVVALVILFPSLLPSALRPVPLPGKSVV